MTETTRNESIAKEESKAVVMLEARVEARKKCNKKDVSEREVNDAEVNE